LISGVLQREAKQHETGIAVDRLRARVVGERLLADCDLERRASALRLVIRTVCGQARRVFEQIPERYLLAVFAGPPRNPVAYAIVESHPATRNLAGDQRRCAEDLRQRREIVDRVRIDCARL
jgi:hypothetical protein